LIVCVQFFESGEGIFPAPRKLNYFTGAGNTIESCMAANGLFNLDRNIGEE